MKSHEVTQIGAVIGLFVSLALVGSYVCNAQQQEPSEQAVAIEQAIGQAKLTGAPIVVVAGRSTCPNCANLLTQLESNEMRRVTYQAIPLKIDVDVDEWRTFARQFGRPDGTTLPFVYVLRADGEVLHGHSGPMEDRPLLNAVAGAIANAGRVFNETEANQVKETVTAAIAHQDDGRGDAAMVEMKKLVRIGTLGEFGSFAEASLLGDQLVNDLLQAALDRKVSALDDVATQTDALRALTDLLQTQRLFGMIPAAREEMDPVMASLRRDPATRETMRNAVEIDRLRRLAESTRTRQRAIDGYERLIAAATESDVIEIATEDLSRLQDE